MQTVSPNDALPVVEHVMPGGHRLKQTDFFGSSDSYDGPPQVALSEFWRNDPSREAEELVPPHFHHVRQFIVFTDDELPSVAEHEQVPRFSFQFTDPSIPYGPVMVDGSYMAFFALRSRPDVGGHLLDTSADKRRPGKLQRSIVVRIPEGEPASGVLEPLLTAHEDGLAGFRLVIAPGETAAGPDPSSGDGQYYVVMTGSLVDGERELPPLSLVWVGGDEQAPSLRAGAEGASLLVLQFPFPDPAAEITEADLAVSAAG